MCKKRILSYIIIIWMTILAAFPLTTAFASSKVYHVPIYNEVERGFHAFFERALAMADVEVDLPELRVGNGDLLTLSASEAHYSKGTVADFQELLVATSLKGSDVVPIEPTFAEIIARFITNPVVVPILLSIASLGLVVELYSPRFGVSGIMGLSALGLFFFGHIVAGFASYETLFIFLAGLALVIAEFFVPGGIVGILGGVLIVLSLLMAGASITQMVVAIFIALIVALIGMVILMKFFGKQLHVLNKLVLLDTVSTEEGYVSNVNRTELLEKVGVTITPLRPAGTIHLDSERIDVVSEGSYVDVGKNVEVVKVEGSRIVVRPTEKEMEE